MAQNPPSEWDQLPVIRPGTGTPSTPAPGTSVTLPQDWQTLPMVRPAQAGTPPPDLPGGLLGRPPTPPPDASTALMQQGGFSDETIQTLQDQSKVNARKYGLAKTAGMAIEGAMGAGTSSFVTRGLATGLPRWAARVVAGGAGSGVGSLGNEAIVQPTLTNTPPPNPHTMLRHASDAAITGALFEGAVAPAISAAWRGAKDAVSHVAGRMVGRTMTPEGRAAAEYMEGQVLPGQVSGSPTFQFLDNLAGATFGRGRYNVVKDAQEREFQRRAAEIVAEAGPLASRSEGGHAMRAGLLRQAGEAAQDEAAVVARRVAEVRQQAADRAVEAESAAGRALQAVQARFGTAMGQERTGRYAQDLLVAAHESADRFQNELYEDLWAQAEGLPVDLSRLTGRAGELAEEVGALGAKTGVQGRAGRAVGALTAPQQAAEEAAEAQAKAVAKIPGRDTANRVISQMSPNDPRRLELEQTLREVEDEVLRSMGAEGTEEMTLSPRQLHRLRSFYGRMGRSTSGPDKGTFDQLLKAADETLAESLGDDLYAQYQLAGTLHKQMKQDFEEGALAAAIEAHPTQVLSKLTGRKEALSDIALARTKIGQQGWTAVQARVWDDLVRHADGSDKTPKQILAALRDWSPDELSAVFHGADDVIAGVRGPLSAAEMARDEATKMAGRTFRGPKETDLRALAQAKTYNLVGTTLAKADPEDIPKLRAAVGEEGWKKVQSVRLQQLFAAAPGADPEGTATAREFSKRLAQAGDRLEPTFGREMSNFLHIWGRMRNQLAKKNPVGDVGRVYLQLATGGAVGGLLTGLFTGSLTKGAVTSGAIVLTPYVMARIATSPAMQRALIGAGRATIDGNAKLASSFIANLSGQLVREGLIGEKAQPPSGATPVGAGAGRATDQPLGRGQGPGPGALAGTPPPQPPSRFLTPRLDQ